MHGLEPKFHEAGTFGGFVKREHTNTHTRFMFYKYRYICYISAIYLLYICYISTICLLYICYIPPPSSESLRPRHSTSARSRQHVTAVSRNTMWDTEMNHLAPSSSSLDKMEKSKHVVCIVYLSILSRLFFIIHQLSACSKNRSLKCDPLDMRKCLSLHVCVHSGNFIIY